jgi:hypothetical protein
MTVMAGEAAIVMLRVVPIIELFDMMKEALVIIPLVIMAGVAIVMPRVAIVMPRVAIVMPRVAIVMPQVIMVGEVALVPIIE